jgi:hypothetical protein
MLLLLLFAAVGGILLLLFVVCLFVFTAEKKFHENCFLFLRHLCRNPQLLFSHHISTAFLAPTSKQTRHR